jgi:MFS family permease
MSVVIGLAAGYLAGVFDKPPAGNQTIKTGAFAGLISGVGALLGQVLGSVINSFLVGPDKATQFMDYLGYQLQNPEAFQSRYWIGMVGGTICCSVMDIILMAGFGILGALAWGKFSRDRIQDEKTNSGYSA